MHELIKFWDDNWWWLIWVGGGAAEWVADQFGAGVAAISKRRRRRIKHREKLRALEIEGKRRALESAHPRPVKPTCGCGHDVAFHNRESLLCFGEGSKANGKPICGCQGYIGPEPLPTYYADPLAELDNLHPEGDGK